jgi:hypothetical protein
LKRSPWFYWRLFVRRSRRNLHPWSSLDTENGRAPLGGTRAQKNRRGCPAGLDAILKPRR